MSQPVGPIRFNTEDRQNQQWIFPRMGALMFTTQESGDSFCFVLYINAAEIKDLWATYPTAEQRDRKLNELLDLVMPPPAPEPDFDKPRITE